MRELTHRVWHDFTLCELQLTHRIGDMDVPDLHALRRLFPDKGTALLPLQEPSESEWLPCPEGWVQVMTDADGLRTVQGISSTDPAAYLKPSLQPGQSYQP